jgi:hypothetical protein
MNFKKVLAGVAAGSMVAAMAVVPTFAEDGNEAYLMFSCADGKEGNGGHWEYGAAENASDTLITGNGQYTVSYTVGGDGAASIDLLVVQTDIDEDDAVSFAIDSITVGDTAVAYNGPSAEAIKYDGGMRCNIYNVWGNDIKDIDNAVEVPSGTVVSVTFTISGLANDAASTETTDTDDSANDGDVAPVAYLAAVVALAGIAMAASKKVRA